MPCRVTGSTRFSIGGQIKVVSGPALFNVAEVGAMVETKFMHNTADSATAADTKAFQATATGTVPIRTRPDATPGNCTLITISVNQVDAVGRLREYAQWPADTPVPFWGSYGCPDASDPAKRNMDRVR